MPRLDDADLLALLDQHHQHPKPDRKGERWVPCPRCGKPSTATNKHFSYSARGGFCWSGGCGYQAGTYQVAQDLGLLDGGRDKYLPPPAPSPPPPRPLGWWVEEAEALAAHYASHPQRVRCWQQHKPLSAATIQRWQLGIGQLPRVARDHEPEGARVFMRTQRLIIPIRQQGELVGLFGRSLGRGGNWLPAPDAPDTRWCFGLDAVQPGSVVWIMENKVDAMLWMQHFPDHAAISPVNIALRDEWHAWAAQLKALRPALIVVALDHDLAGNGGGSERQAMLGAWRDEMRRKHPERWRELRRGDPSGPAIAAILAQHRLPVRLYEYPAGTPWGASAADLLWQPQQVAA